MTETLLQKLGNSMRKKYTAKAKCSNCGAIQEVKIPKGITIEEFFEGELGKCDRCDCASLEQLKGKALSQQEKEEERLKKEESKKREENKNNTYKIGTNLWGPGDNRARGRSGRV